METKPPDSLPPPPPDGLARLSYADGMLRIELKPIFAPWTKIAYAMSLPLMFACGGFTAFCAAELVKANTFLSTWLIPCVLGGIVSYFFFMVLLLGIMLPSLYGLLTCDGKTLFIKDCQQQFMLLIEQIRGIELTILKERSRRICPEKPPSKFFRIAPAGALDIDLPQGRIRLFRRWEIEDLCWLQQTLNTYLNLHPTKPLGTTSETTTVDSLTAQRYSGSNWKLAFAVCLLGGLLLLSISAPALFFGNASRKWPTVQGQVTFSEFKVLNDSRTARMSYAYRVGDRQLENNRISYGGSASEDDVQQIVQTHPRGSSIAVYYDPANITRSVLLRGTYAVDWVLLSMGLGVLGLCVLLWKRRMLPQQHRLMEKYQIAGKFNALNRSATDDNPMDRLFK